MDMVHDIFAHRRVLWERLPHLGFAQSKDGLVRTSVLPGTGLVLEVVVSDEGKVFTTVTDPAFGEPYTLHLTDEAVGAFVGRVREEYVLALQEIADKATVLDVFRTTQAQSLIDYALHSFDEALEHLWPKTPEYAILRRADTDKWYAVFMRIPGTKIGLASPELIEIIDLRVGDEDLAGLVNRRIFFPGWHMNKKTWYTILFDSGLAFEELCARLARSRRLALR